jgi:pimeloyl-ACP methyl ester carboxylesterase
LLYISGEKDRLVTESSLHEVRRGKPDALVASIDAPHLLLQAEPRVAVDALVSFLLRVGTESEPEVAGE